MTPWVIHDWAGNTCFQGKEFLSFEDAEEFLSERLGDEIMTQTEANTIYTKKEKGNVYTITIEQTGLDSPKLLIKLQGHDVAYYGDNFGELLDAMSQYLGHYCSTIED